MGRRRRSGAGMLSLSECWSSGYVAASINEFRKVTGLPSMGASADYHYRTQGEYLRMIELARSFDRNDQVVGPALNRVVNNVIQGGFTPDPNTGDPEIDKRLKALFRGWACNPSKCHRGRRHTFREIEGLVLRSVLRDGDVLPIPLDNGQLQVYEAHRLRTPNNTRRNVVHGVLIGEDDGAPREYWVTRKDVGIRPVASVNNDITKLPAWDENDNPAVFHVYNPKRFDQTRGISALAPCADAVGMNDDTQFATMVQKKMISCFGVLVEKAAQMDVPGTDPALGSVDSETLDDGTALALEQLLPGLVYRGRPGEKLTTFNSNVPGQGFFDHTMLILTFIAINLDLPLQVLLLDPTKTNFSGWRGAIDEARKGWKVMQGWMIDKFHGPVWHWLVNYWLKEDETLRGLYEQSADVVDIHEHRWNPPSWDYIEPDKDSKSDERIIGSNLNSPRRVLGKRGADWDEISQELVTDKGRLIELAINEAKRIKAATGVDVEWTQVLGWITAGEKFDAMGADPGADPGGAGGNNDQEAAA